eukprot:TRINITY_DN4834_c0_g1_i2.p2 TRINITY_DN4834_c0_g1~~TRINITY_DN4834_c0_g1_i2.p2  ORF type:complete len:265 (-),score=86.64 TRINITY_DN4834_c0_g1_i2:393-1187(-)
MRNPKGPSRSRLSQRSPTVGRVSSREARAWAHILFHGVNRATPNINPNRTRKSRARMRPGSEEDLPQCVLISSSSSGQDQVEVGQARVVRVTGQNALGRLQAGPLAQGFQKCCQLGLRQPCEGRLETLDVAPQRGGPEGGQVRLDGQVVDDDPGRLLHGQVGQVAHLRPERDHVPHQRQHMAVLFLGLADLQLQGVAHYLQPGEHAQGEDQGPGGCQLEEAFLGGLGPAGPEMVSGGVAHRGSTIRPKVMPPNTSSRFSREKRQ